MTNILKHMNVWKLWNRPFTTKNDGILNVYIFKNIDRIDRHVLLLKITSFLSYYLIFFSQSQQHYFPTKM